MSGYTKTHRSVFSHDFFDGDEFSRREAWLWMIAQAAWKPHRFRHKKTMVPLERGELPGARKHLAAVWKWGEQRVRTFLAELATEGMITTKTNHGVTIISICNYCEYQSTEDKLNQELTSSQPASNHTEEGKEGKEYNRFDSKQPLYRKAARENQSAVGAEGEMRQALVADPYFENRTRIIDGQIVLSPDDRRRWLQTFPDEKTLDLALMGVTVQSRSREPVEAQVRRQLSHIARTEHGKDRRYRERIAETQAGDDGRLAETKRALEAMEVM